MIRSKTINIAIFADLHGRILLCFKLCARWQQETGERIDLILQAGDLAAFPITARLDKATRRYAESDPTELGFMTHFVQYDKQVASQLAMTSCPLIFVRGNHEDHIWLDDLEQQAPGPIFSVDPYRRVWCLKSGVPYTFQANNERLTMLGIGRIGLRASNNPADGPPHVRLKHIQPYEQQRIRALDFSQCKPDVLLTHDSARDFIFPGAGIDEIGMALTQSSPPPVYHFFGHYGGPSLLRPDTNGQTIACKLADLHWDLTSSGQILEAGSMAILRWHSREEQELSIVDAAWFKEYSAFTWMHL